jgi:signal transduction histidine kinase
MKQVDLYEMFADFPIAILLVNKEGLILAASKYAESILGAAHNQLASTNLSAFSRLSEPEIVDALKLCARSTQPLLVPLKLFNTETHGVISSRGCLFKSKSVDSAKTKKIIIHLESQSTFSKSLLELNRQINKQKMLIGQLNITNQELKRSNDALESFAYVASHDLRSPLRAIHQLTSWLKEDLEAKIDAKDLANLNLIQSRINRMENLLDDLLAYSRVGIQHKSLEMTDVNVLANDTLQILNTNGSFTLKMENPIPSIEINRILLEQILLNLFSNAIKHHDRDTGEITIRYSELERFHQFEIADDGPGIPLEFQDIVFTMFKTLRSRDEVEGSGMGLAIVKKIVESCGCSIQLLNNSPRGARFIFTWPKNY